MAMKKISEMNWIERMRFVSNIHGAHPKGYPTDRQLMNDVDPSRLTPKQFDDYITIIWND